MPRPYWGKLFEIFKLEFIEQSIVVRSWSGDLQGVSKGGSNAALRCLKKLVCFPFWPSGESEDRTEGPQLLLCLLSCQHKKVGPPAGDQLPAVQSLNYEAAIFSIVPMLTLPISIYRVVSLWVFALKIGSSWFEAERFTDDRLGRGADDVI
jgi:hypothetical protein